MHLGILWTTIFYLVIYPRSYFNFLPSPYLVWLKEHKENAEKRQKEEQERKAELERLEREAEERAESKKKKEIAERRRIEREQRIESLKKTPIGIRALETITQEVDDSAPCVFIPFPVTVLL